MVTYRQALDTILQLPLALRTERIPLLECVGRVLCEEISAPFALPRFDQSAMDGYAVRVADPQQRTFAVVGESAAGHPFPESLPRECAVRISTGALLPPGATHVVPREQVAEATDTSVTFQTLPEAGVYIRRRGEDVAEGTGLFPVGTRITPAMMAFLAMFNLPNVAVHGRPRVAILGSGDEVRLLGQALGPADIVASGLYYLAAEFEAMGCEASIMGVSPDKAGAFEALLRQALEWGDFVVSTAGVSVGDHDVVGAALTGVGAQVHFWKVAVRPGKPMLVATAAGKPFFGLPGNPVSTFCNTEIFLKPFLRQKFGTNPSEVPWEMLPLGADCFRDRERLFFVTARLETTDGVTRALPLANQSSGNLFNAALAQALVVVEPGAGPLRGGERVPVLRLGAGV
jgi:molybdopterin molybdotransferase